MSYTVPSTAKIQSASPITWSDGSLFSGYILFGLALPTDVQGAQWAELRLYGTSQRLPVWTVFPIVEGQIDTNTTLFYTTQLDPPNTRYAAYWYDNTWKLIYPIGAPPVSFSITTNPCLITQPYLQAPAVPTDDLIPVPQFEDPEEADRNLIEYTLAGTANGVNTIFVIPVTEVRGASVFIDGQKQDTSTYTRVGSVVTFNTAPVILSSITAQVNIAIGATSTAGFLVTSTAGTISGAINGSNIIYTLVGFTNIASLDFAYNGTVLTQGIDYTLVGNVVTLTTLIPSTTDVLRARVWT